MFLCVFKKEKMGRRKKGGKKKGGNALEDAASGDEAGLEEPEMFDEVDAFESRNDDVLRKALKARFVMLK